MRFHALVTDFDETLADGGRVSGSTIAALEELRTSGRALLLVTGRELPDLRSVFDRLDLFDRVVAENGGVLYAPGSETERKLAEPPPETLATLLRERSVEPLAIGRVIVSTREPHETTVIDAIRELGLERQIVFNRGAVMVLPSGVSKASGAQIALDELGISFRNVAGIGDAENDHSFLEACELSFTVSNAIDGLKEVCDRVTRGSRGAGVVEVVERMIADDLAEVARSVERLLIPLGRDDEGEALGVRPDQNLMVAGPSASGKSTLTAGFLEELMGRGYQFCLVDPEGDYDEIDGAITFGTPDAAPELDSLMDLLADPSQNATVNLLGIPLGERPAAVSTLLPRLHELRTSVGRPNWIVIDEAHHVLPHVGGASAKALPADPFGMATVTVHPEHVAGQILSGTDLLVVTGDVDRALDGFARAAGLDTPPPFRGSTEPKERAVAWFPNDGRPAETFRPTRPRQELKRHVRKYARGDMEEDAFVFRGPKAELNLRAQNLELFVQIAAGVDDETWLYHLRRGDYASWIEGAIGDDGLVEAIEHAQEVAGDDAQESRRLVAEAIAERYTLPA